MDTKLKYVKYFNFNYMHFRLGTNSQCLTHPSNLPLTNSFSNSWALQKAKGFLTMRNTQFVSGKGLQRVSICSVDVFQNLGNRISTLSWKVWTLHASGGQRCSQGFHLIPHTGFEGVPCVLCVHQVRLKNRRTNTLATQKLSTRKIQQKGIIKW
jgi:hypothetical protein